MSRVGWRGRAAAVGAAAVAGAASIALPGVWPGVSPVVSPVASAWAADVGAGGAEALVRVEPLVGGIAREDGWRGARVTSRGADGTLRVESRVWRGAAPEGLLAAEPVVVLAHGERAALRIVDAAGAVEAGGDGGRGGTAGDAAAPGSPPGRTWVIPRASLPEPRHGWLLEELGAEDVVLDPGAERSAVVDLARAVAAARAALAEAGHVVSARVLAPAEAASKAAWGALALGAAIALAIGGGLLWASARAARVRPWAWVLAPLGSAALAAAPAPRPATTVEVDALAYAAARTSGQRADGGGGAVPAGAIVFAHVTWTHGGGPQSTLELAPEAAGWLRPEVAPRRGVLVEPAWGGVGAAEVVLRTDAADPCSALHAALHAPVAPAVRCARVEGAARW